MQIEVHGLASGKVYPIDYNPEDLSEILLYFLRKKGITIASSCDGEGVCKRCEIQFGWLTCRLTVGEFLEISPKGKIFVSYL